MKKVMWAFLISIGLTLGSMGVVHAESTTLQSKIDATEEGGTLVLDADYTDSVIISKDITIDFAGHSLTTNGHGIYVESGAEVVITGDGSINATGSVHAAIVNEGTLTVVSGSFNSANWYTVKNFSVMNINGGTFTQGDENKANSSLIANGWYDGSKVNGSNDLGVVPPEKGSSAVAVLTINGGEFVHKTTTSTIKSDDWSKTTITEGTFESQNGFLIQATGTVNVSGGTFTGYNAIATIYGLENEFGPECEPGILTISDGTFNAQYLYRADGIGEVTVIGGTFNLGTRLVVAASSKVSTEITGGTYTVAVDKSYILDGYVVEQNGENFVVKPNLVISTEDENVTFESKEPLPNDYTLVVEEEKLENEEEVTTSITEEITAILEKEEEKLLDSKLVATYDISVKDSNNKVVKLENGNYVISIKVTDEQVKGFTSFKVAYIDDDGKVAEIFDAILKDGVVTFETSHLSTYAIIGYNAVTLSEEDNPTIGDADEPTTPDTPEVPQTFDSLFTYIAVGVVSIIAIVGAVIYIKRKQTN